MWIVAAILFPRLPLLGYRRRQAHLTTLAYYTASPGAISPIVDWETKKKRTRDPRSSRAYDVLQRKRQAPSCTLVFVFLGKRTNELYNARPIAAQ